MAAKLQNRKVQIVVICMLGAVVLYNVLHFAGKKPRKRNFVYEDAGLEADVGEAVVPNWARGEYKAAASWGRNPFTGAAMTRSAAITAPVTAQVDAPPRPRSTPASTIVTGVMISGESRYVLAGDLLLREGDRLGNGRIKTINRNSVIVEYETGTKTIYIE
jgi:hypothetical protein